MSDIHFKNMYQERIHCQDITGQGEIVTGDMYIDDDINLHIFQWLQATQRGVLRWWLKTYVMLVMHFIRQQVRNSEDTGAGLLLEQLRQIESCNAKYISLSHRTHFKYSKRAVVRWLKAIYKLRGANEAYIYL